MDSLDWDVTSIPARIRMIMQILTLASLGPVPEWRKREIKERETSQLLGLSSRTSQYDHTMLASTPQCTYGLHYYKLCYAYLGLPNFRIRSEELLTVFRVQNHFVVVFMKSFTFEQTFHQGVAMGACPEKLRL